MIRNVRNNDNCNNCEVTESLGERTVTSKCLNQECPYRSMVDTAGTYLNDTKICHYSPLSPSHHRQCQTQPTSDNLILVSFQQTPTYEAPPKLIVDNKDSTFASVHLKLCRDEIFLSQFIDSWT